MYVRSIIIILIIFIFEFIDDVDFGGLFFFMVVFILLMGGLMDGVSRWYLIFKMYLCINIYVMFFIISIYLLKLI